MCILLVLIVFRSLVFQWWHMWTGTVNGSGDERNQKISQDRGRGNRKKKENRRKDVTDKICRRDPTLCVCYHALRTVEREINNTSYHKEMQFIYHTDKLWRKPIRYKEKVQKLMIDTRVRRRLTRSGKGHPPPTSGASTSFSRVRL